MGAPMRHVLGGMLAAALCAGCVTKAQATAARCAERSDRLAVEPPGFDWRLLPQSARASPGAAPATRYPAPRAAIYRSTR